MEVYTYKDRQYPDALDVCTNIAELGFVNRGVKAGTDLYVIRKTKAKSMLLEVCFSITSKILIYIPHRAAQIESQMRFLGLYGTM